MSLSPRLLELLLAPTPVPGECPDVSAWWPRQLAITRDWGRPFERSIAGGLAADRAGWAFASGYQASLRALLPALPDEAVAAMCVSEDGGNQPRAIRSTLRDSGDGRIRLDGSKRWTTLGPASALLLVAAVDLRGEPGARAQIRVVRVDAGAPGVALHPMPETRFVPEVPHASVDFDAVAIQADALLPGDGYDGYVKPFRTIEDTQVSSAVLAYLFAESRRRDWPHAWCERALATLLAFSGVALLDPAAASTHIALAGALASAHELFDQAGALFADGPQDAAARRWARDRALLQVAASVRAQRTARAWERAEGVSRPPPSA